MTTGRTPDRASVQGYAFGATAVLAIACCAAGPVLAGVLGAIGLGAVLGVGVGLVAVVVLITLVVVSRSRLDRCRVSSDRRSQP